MKSLLNTPSDHTPDTQNTIDGSAVPGHAGELLIDLLNRRTAAVGQDPAPQVCSLAQMGPIQSCDTCMVKVNGALTRACATDVVAEMKVETTGEAVDIAQHEAFDRILQNHMLYCTVYDTNNQNCTIHNTTTWSRGLNHPSAMDQFLLCQRWKLRCAISVRSAPRRCARTAL
jgi:formate dehydrogenase major subunit